MKLAKCLKQTELYFWLFFSVFLTSAYSQSIHSIQFEFQQIIKRQHESEIVVGYLFYSGQKTTLKIVNPINQWIVFEKNRTLLYYPDLHRAIEIKSQNPVTLPFFQAFAGIHNIDAYLTELDYTLEKSEMRGDTLFSFWCPPAEAKKVIGYYIVAITKDKIIYSKIQDIRGNILAKSNYLNHLTYKGSQFPLEIITTQYVANDSTVEHIRFSNPVFNELLPADVTEFKIPLGTDIKVVEW